MTLPIEACLYCPHTFFTLKDRGPGAKYEAITYEAILEKVRTPNRFPKSKAPFFIPSAYREIDGRSHDPQRQNGNYWYLTLDIDGGDLDAEVIQSALESVIGEHQYLIYSTSSARADNKKWRVLVPLANPIAGVDFEDTQDAFFDLLEENDDRIKCDRALARTGQTVYLPNVPQDRRGPDGAPLFYRHYLVDKALVNLVTDHRVIVRRESNRAEEAAIAAEIAEAKDERAAKRVMFGRKHLGQSPIEAFNAANPIGSLLQKYHYDRNGDRHCWRSPYQCSNSYATTDFGTHWVSHSESDRNEGIGQIKSTGPVVNGRIFHKPRRTYCWGDAFDLYVHYEHNGDFEAAIGAVVAQQRLASIPQLEIANKLNRFLQDTTECRNGDEPVQHASDFGEVGDGERRADETNFPPLLFQSDDLDAHPDLSDDQLAMELGYAGFDRDALFVASRSKWLFWNGRIWAVDDRCAAMTWVRQFLRAKACQLRDWAQDKLKAADKDDSRKAAEKALVWAEREAKRLRSKDTIAAVLKLATSNAKSAASVEQFDANLHVLATPVGMVDLRSGTLRESCREDFATRMTAVGPARAGTPPALWQKVLHRIFGGDVEMIAFVQRTAGYALTGSVAEHKLLFLYGTGRNGKSVFLNTLMGIWGDYARRAAASVFLDKVYEGHPTEIAGLQGARLVVGSELPPGKIWNEAAIKELTGGDKLTARYMRQDFFDFTPQFTLMIAGNHQPGMRGVDEAMRARMVLIPFEVTIPEDERDSELEAKLRQEWPAILRWCIDGAVAWYQQGLNPPEKVLRASEEYLEDENLIGRYLDESIYEDLNGRVSNRDVAADFNDWAALQGIKLWSQTALTKALKETGRFGTYKSGNDRGFTGFVLRRQGQRTRQQEADDIKRARFAKGLETAISQIRR